jgi:hypothetical protein
VSLTKTQLDIDIDRQIMTVARLVRHNASPGEIDSARKQLAGMVLRRKIEKAMVRAGALSPTQRAEAAAVIFGQDGGR